MRSLSLLFLFAVLATGCGSGTPTTPDAPPVARFHAGRYVLSLHGIDSSAVPGYEPCSPPNALPEHNSLHLRVDLTREGSEWVARSAAGTGDLVMGFRDSLLPDGRIALNGSITGSGVDGGYPPLVPVLHLRVVFNPSGGAPTIVEGAAHAALPHAEGFLRGSAEVSNPSGNRQHCPTFEWLLSPPTF